MLSGDGEDSSLDKDIGEPGRDELGTALPEAESGSLNGDIREEGDTAGGSTSTGERASSETGSKGGGETGKADLGRRISAASTS